MSTPSVDLQHIKTSQQYEGDSLINRYWFQWKNRRVLTNVIIRLDLLDQDGKVLTTTSVKLSRTKITGYTPATKTEPQRPIYDGSVWIHIDDVVRDEQPAQFSFYTVTGSSQKSEVVIGKIDGLRISQNS